MAPLHLTQRKVRLVLTGPKKILSGPVQATIRVKYTFHDFLDKVMDHVDNLPSGLKINRLRKGCASNTDVSLRCRIGEFLETHYKREMPIYKVRLVTVQPRKSVPTKKAFGGRASPRVAAVHDPPSSSKSPSILAALNEDSSEVSENEAALNGSGEVPASNGNPEDVSAMQAGQGSGDAEPPNEGPGDPEAPAASPEGSIVGSASNGNPEDVSAMQAGQGSGEAEPPIQGPADPVPPGASQEGSIVGSASNGDPNEMMEAIVPDKIAGRLGVVRQAVVLQDQVSVEKFEEDVTPEVEVVAATAPQAPVGSNADEVPTCSRRVHLQDVMNNCTEVSGMMREIREKIATPPETLVPPSSLRSTPASSSIVSVQIKHEWTEWDSDSVLADLRQDGIKIVDMKTQSHRRLAGVSNTLLLLAMEEKKKLKGKWQALYGRAPVCARLLEEFLKD